MTERQPTEGERERAIRGLRESYARGDLNGEQLEEKLDALFAVETVAELRELVPAGAYGSGSIPPPPLDAGSTDLDTVEHHLASDERVEWLGKPDPTKRFTTADRFLVPFSLVWGGFSIFWETLAIAGGAGAFFALFGIPFVAIGLYVIFGRFIYKTHRKRRTIYAVTNRRVMEIVRGRHGESVAAVHLRSIPSISTSAVSNGQGSVEFGVSPPRFSQYANTGLELFGRGQLASGVSFFDIEDPEGVAVLVERLRAVDQSR